MVHVTTKIKGVHDEFKLNGSGNFQLKDESQVTQFLFVISGRELGKKLFRLSFRILRNINSFNGPISPRCFLRTREVNTK